MQERKLEGLLKAPKVRLPFSPAYKLGAWVMTGMGIGFLIITLAFAFYGKPDIVFAILGSLFSLIFLIGGIALVLYVSGSRYLVLKGNELIKAWVKNSKVKVEWSVPIDQVELIFLERHVSRRSSSSSSASTTITYRLMLQTRDGEKHEITSEQEYPYVRLIAEEVVNLVDLPVYDRVSDEEIQRGVHGVSISAELQVRNEPVSSEGVLENIRRRGFPVVARDGRIEITFKRGVSLFSLVFLGFVVIFIFMFYQMGALDPSTVPLPVVLVLAFFLIIAFGLLVATSVKRRLIIDSTGIDVREQFLFFKERSVARIPLFSVEPPRVVWGKVFLVGWNEEGELVIVELASGGEDLRDELYKLLAGLISAELAGGNAL